MKSEDLSDAIGMMGEETAAAAKEWRERSVPGKKYKVLQSAAAVILILGVAGLLTMRGFFHTGGENGNPLEDKNSLENDKNGNSEVAYMLCQPEYPRMAKYPDETEYVDKVTGDFDSGKFSAAYETWTASRRAQQNQPEGYTDGLFDFFAASFQEFLADSEGENAAYAPVNVYMALGMLAEVTEGNSRSQILSLLNAGDMEALRRQVYSVWNANYCIDGARTSVFANSLWLRHDMDYREETLKNLAKNDYAYSFRGEMGSEDYNKAARSWLSRQTGGFLDEECRDIGFDGETVLGLMSTVYFQARWQNEFWKDNTQEGIFHGKNGDVNCSFMRQSENDTYYWGENYSAVAKRFESGGEGMMWFILPDEGISVETVLAGDEVLQMCFATDSARYNDWENKKSMKVNLSVPKFDISSKTDLRQGLKNMGITDVFDSKNADFSPLTPESDGIFLSQAEHAVRVAIDEEGCVAAAYTVMAASGAALPLEEEIDFVLNRPFLFVITGDNGLPMFAGIVNQPSPAFAK